MVDLRDIEKYKLRVARAYNKKVKLKSFQVDDLVWKVILPIGSKDRKFGKGIQVGQVLSCLEG